MFKKSFFLGCVCAVGLAASPALADGLSATISGDYLNLDLHKYGISGNAWGGAGELQSAISDTGVHIQGDASYRKVSLSGVDLDLSSVNGSLFFPFDSGRVGGEVGYQNLHVSGLGSGHTTSYGGFGEFWAGDMVTLGVKGGGFSGSGLNGYYLGSEAKVYATPDVAVDATIGHTGDHGETDYSIAGEWLISEDIPLGISGGYTYADLPYGLSHANVWFLRATIYWDDTQQKTLVDRQRNGNLGWATGTGTLGIQF